MMKVNRIELAWISVSDMAKAKEFFCQTLGLTLSNESPEYGWLELKGSEGGATLGVGQGGEMSPISPGQHAIVTLTVDHLAQVVETLKERGVKLIGEIQEIPGHVRMQLIADPDGNYFQLVEKLAAH
ncbi:MAG: hypothetical protein K0S07_661 [Chlamydiales bacterium]|jgi:predicted enzyme related to lactoylglutathione lyase|nr:hypothetical protein [Chlamydiales bacterium]